MYWWTINKAARSYNKIENMIISYIVGLKLVTEYTGVKVYTKSLLYK